MANTDKKRRHITAGEVITVIAVILCLTAGLGFSFHFFTEKAEINTVKDGAIKTYSALSAYNIKVENTDYSTEETVKELFPDIYSFGINENDFKQAINEKKVKDGEYAVSTFERSASGFSFTYYQFLNGKLYSVQYINGIIGEVEMILKSDK